MSRSLSSHVLAVVVTFGLVSPHRASGHTRPEVLGLVADDGERVLDLRISHGLVSREASGRLRFMCPSLWGGPEAPLAAKFGDAMVAVGALSPHLILRDGTSSSFGASRVQAFNTRQLIAGPNGPIALAADETGAAVVELRPGGAQTLGVFSEPFQAIALEGDQVLVARPSVRGVHLEALSLSGGAPVAREIDATLAPGTTLALGYVQGATYVVLNAAGTSTLARVRGAQLEPVLSSTSAIQGPVSSGEALVALVGGVLHRFDEDDLGVTEPTRRFTCLERGAVGAYVCSGTQLVALTEDGAAGPVAFELREVEGPSLQALRALPEASALACRLEWRDFAAETGLDPTLADERPSPNDVEEEVGCDCRDAGHPSSAPPGRWALVVVFGWALAARSPSASKLGRPRAP